MSCILNARRCRRTHCRFTGSFYLAMIIPALALGFVSYGFWGWLVLGAVAVLGDKVIWCATKWPGASSLRQCSLSGVGFGSVGDISGRGADVRKESESVYIELSRVSVAEEHRRGVSKWTFPALD